MAGGVALWPSLTGGQVLDALASLRGRRDRAREDELIERLALDPTKKVRTYSKGSRQKVALVAALAAPTGLLILDEPTTGLDPLMEQVFMDEVTRAATQGRTVLLSSHVLDEVQRLCSTVTIIKDGRVVEQGDLARLQQLARTQVEVGGDADLLRGIAASLPQLEDALSIEDGRLSVQVRGAQVPQVLAAIATQGATDVVCRPASLEGLFLRHYEDEHTEVHR